jgi:hypothetical protein
MPPKINRTQTPATPISIKTIVWRIVLTILILSALAGPGAERLQKMVLR